MDRLLVRAGWNKRHREACLGVDGVAFQEKAGYKAITTCSCRVEQKAPSVSWRCTRFVVVCMKREVTSLRKDMTSNPYRDDAGDDVSYGEAREKHR